MKYKYTVDVFVYNKDFTSMLFVKKDKPGQDTNFFTPGGLIKDEEHPGAAAKRAVLEETGMKIELVDFRPGLPSVLDSSTVRLPNPVHVQVEFIDKQTKHITFVFLAEFSGENDRIDPDFSGHIKWISLSEINNKQIPKTTKEMALYLFKFKQEY